MQENKLLMIWYYVQYIFKYNMHIYIYMYINQMHNTLLGWSVSHSAKHMVDPLMKCNAACTDSFVFAQQGRREDIHRNPIHLQILLWNIARMPFRILYHMRCYPKLIHLLNLISIQMGNLTMMQSNSENQIACCHNIPPTIIYHYNRLRYNGKDQGSWRIQERDAL